MIKMKRVGAAAASLIALAVILLLVGAKPPLPGHPAVSRLRTRVWIVQLSGIRLVSLFVGLPIRPRIPGTADGLLLRQPCRSRPGLLERAAVRAGLETIAYAQSNCENEVGGCYGCPNNGNGGVSIEDGDCTGICGSGTADDTQAAYDPDSERGYGYTGATACTHQNGCPCVLTYCEDCTPGG